MKNDRAGEIEQKSGQESHRIHQGNLSFLPMPCHVKPCNTMPCERPDMCLLFPSPQNQTQKENHRSKHYSSSPSISHHSVLQLSSHHQRAMFEVVECKEPLFLNLPLSRSSSRSIPLDIRPALLFGPELLVMRLGMHLELLEIGVDDFLAAVGALERNAVSACPLFDLPFPLVAQTLSSMETCVLFTCVRVGFNCASTCACFCG